MNRFALLTCVYAIFVTPYVYAQTELVEGLTPGSQLVGQHGWTAVPGTNTTGVTVDGNEFSPFMGSTQSIHFQGVSASAQVQRMFTPAITFGSIAVGYDFNLSYKAAGGGNLLGSVSFNPASGNGSGEFFGPFIQNGGTFTAAMNANFDPDGIGGASYANHPFITNKLFDPVHWYRLEFILDFDNFRVLDPRAYDIASGAKVLVGTGSNVYFRNNGSTFFHEWGTLQLGFGPATASEGWNFDNFTAQSIPEPTTIILCGIGLATLIPNRFRGRGFRALMRKSAS